RVVAADTSGFVSLPPEQPATTQSTKAPVAAQANAPESGQTVEQLQAELTTARTRIAELEQAAAAADAARGEAAQAQADAELAKGTVEQTAVAEKAKLEATIARLQAATAEAKAGWRQSALPGAIGGLLGVLTTGAVGFFM